MSEKKYVAYVGCYTHGSSRQGIHVYDVDIIAHFANTHNTAHPIFMYFSKSKVTRF